MHRLPLSADTPWYREVFLNGLGTALISGVVAVLVAWLTVRWTLEGTRASAQEAGRRERSYAAAFALTEALTDAWTQISTWRPIIPGYGGARTSPDIDLTRWLQYVALYAPDLIDLEVHQRVDQVSAELVAFDDWTRQPPRGPEGLTMKQNELPARLERLIPIVSWLGQTLAAHRNDKPLPAALGSPDAAYR